MGGCPPKGGVGVPKMSGGPQNGGGPQWGGAPKWGLRDPQNWEGPQNRGRGGLPKNGGGSPKIVGGGHFFWGVFSFCIPRILSSRSQTNASVGL